MWFESNNRRSILSTARSVLFAIKPEEANFDRRGFPAAGADARARLENAGKSFIGGYALAIKDPALGELAAELNKFAPLWRGFAYEGAGMGLSLLDRTSFVHDRFQRFAYGPASRHVYLTYVGAGWALAALPWTRNRIQRFIEPMEQPLKWLLVDGYGFHEGYFHWRKTIQRQARPQHLVGYAPRAFDQGLGRSLWFFAGADPARAAAKIAEFPEARRGDLWSGAGLACCYAGGCPVQEIHELKARAGAWGMHVAQGAVFAAKARKLSATVTDETEAACSILTNLSVVEAASLADAALEACCTADPNDLYEQWRERIRAATKDVGARVGA